MRTVVLRGFLLDEVINRLEVMGDTYASDPCPTGQACIDEIWQALGERAYQLKSKRVSLSVAAAEWLADEIKTGMPWDGWYDSAEGLERARIARSCDAAFRVAGKLEDLDWTR